MQARVADTRLANLGYVGKWQGLHFYSRETTDHQDQLHFLRRICIEIFSSGEAKLKYLDTVSGEEDEMPKPGRLSLGSSGLQIFMDFSYEVKGIEPYTVRVLFCLNRKEQNEKYYLLGSYVGFSPTSRQPYAGPVSFRKLRSDIGEQASIQNVYIKSTPNSYRDWKDADYISQTESNKQYQTYQLWDDADIASLQEAYEKYLETPEKSLSKTLHARFRKYKLKHNLNGEYITIGIGSGGKEESELNKLVSYPMLFRDGLCTTFWEPGKPPITSPIRAISERDRYIWLHFRNETRLTNLSYYINDINSKEYKGVSYRLNTNDKLQARTEILIKKDMLSSDEQVLKLYEHGTDEYSKLRIEYYNTYPFFKELIDSFEAMVDRNVASKHILQNKTTPTSDANATVLPVRPKGPKGNYQKKDSSRKRNK